MFPHSGPGIHRGTVGSVSNGAREFDPKINISLSMFADI